MSNKMITYSIEWKPSIKNFGRVYVKDARSSTAN